jgi:AcrR family transcriptional regulator
MRYKPEHMAQARAQLINAGAALAKKKGFSNTGLQQLMAAADMTTGAFYTQFRSKPELLGAIVEYELGKVLSYFEGKSPDGLLQALAHYLSPDHVASPEKGCAIPALGAEVGRADPDTRARFEREISRIHRAIADTLSNEEAAWALICQAVGGVLISRAMASALARQAVLGGAMTQARRIIKSSKGELEE